MSSGPPMPSIAPHTRGDPKASPLLGRTDTSARLPSNAIVIASVRPSPSTSPLRRLGRTPLIVPGTRLHSTASANEPLSPEVNTSSRPGTPRVWIATSERASPSYDTRARRFWSTGFSRGSVGGWCRVTGEEPGPDAEQGARQGRRDQHRRTPGAPPGSGLVPVRGGEQQGGAFPASAGRPRPRHGARDATREHPVGAGTHTP